MTNLKEAIGGEHQETTEMYPTFAKEAEAEGNVAAALLFREIDEVEEHHWERFQKLLELVESGMIYERERPIKWKCSVCGYIHEGKESPTTCPCCQYPKEFGEPAGLDFLEVG